MLVVYTVGVNYRSAPLSVREKIAISADAVSYHLKQLKKRFPVREAAVLSTCNRTELYCLSDCDFCHDKQNFTCQESVCRSNIPEQVADWFGSTAAGESATPYLYRYRSRLAVTHLFRVASGLDSELIGEPEITGQVKQFATLARESGSSGMIINRLMESALAAAAEVRNTTSIGKHSLSYPGLAARAATGIFPDLRDTAVLFVGAGDMARAGLPIFRDRGVRRLAVTSRTLDKAEALAKQIGNCDAFPSVMLHDRLAEFDIIISATASQVPIIGKGAVESALRQRKHKPMMFADMAIPRDLEPEIQELNDIFVYNLSQFGKMAENSLENRRTASEQAEIIIERHADGFQKWLRERAVVADIRDFRGAADNARALETDKALRRLARGENPEEVLRDTTRRLTAKLTHLPTITLLKSTDQKK